MTLQDGRAVDKVEVGIFDETAENADLIIWGPKAVSAATWCPSETSKILDMAWELDLKKK